MLPDGPFEEAELKPDAAKHSYTGRDKKLQISRRIDWRFLLPDPNLHRVAYLGFGNDTMTRALNLFSDSLEIIPSTHQATRYPQEDFSFDQFVLQSPNLINDDVSSSLESAYTLLAPGGYLYWEIDCSQRFPTMSELRNKENLSRFARKFFWEKNWGLHHFQDHVSSIEKLGFYAIQVYWHRPNFDSCKEIIPLNDPEALGYIFSRQSDTRSGRFKIVIGRYLINTRILGYLVPHLSVVARKPLSAETR